MPIKKLAGAVTLLCAFGALAGPRTVRFKEGFNVRSLFRLSQMQIVKISGTPVSPADSHLSLPHVGLLLAEVRFSYERKDPELVAIENKGKKPALLKFGDAMSIYALKGTLCSPMPAPLSGDRAIPIFERVTLRKFAIKVREEVDPERVEDEGKSEGCGVLGFGFGSERWVDGKTWVALPLRFSMEIGVVLRAVPERTEDSSPDAQIEIFGSEGSEGRELRDQFSFDLGLTDAQKISMYQNRLLERLGEISGGVVPAMKKI